MQAAPQLAPGSYITASNGILYGVDGQPVVLKVPQGLSPRMCLTCSKGCIMHGSSFITFRPCQYMTGSCMWHACKSLYDAC